MSIGSFDKPLLLPRMPHAAPLLTPTPPNYLCPREHSRQTAHIAKKIVQSVVNRNKGNAPRDPCQGFTSDFQRLLGARSELPNYWELLSSMEPVPPGMIDLIIIHYILFLIM